MQSVSELRQREVETYFNVITRGDSERFLRARAFHNLGEWEHVDYKRLSDMLVNVNATGSFLFLGRDADRYSKTIELLDRAGHEIALHGHRHVACANIDYDLVHENLSQGLNAIEDTTGVTPRGFVSPGQEVNDATLQALCDLDFEWVLGHTDVDIPRVIEFVDLVHPYDLIMLNDGATPSETFERIREQTQSGAALMFHPNMLDYYDGFDELAEWITETTPVSIETLVETGGVGMIHDAMRPLRIE